MGYQLIETIEVGSGGAASIEFTSIPQDGTDLLLVVSARSDRAIEFDPINIQFNGSTSNLSSRHLIAFQTAVNSISLASVVRIGVAPAATATSNTFGNFATLIPNYAGSANKSLGGDYVHETNSSNGYNGIVAGLWANTSAITSLKLVSDAANNFVEHSTASLYIIS